MGDWEWSNMAPTIWMESKNRKAIFKAWDISNINFWIEPPSGWIAQVMALLLFLLMRLDLPFSSQSTKRIKKKRVARCSVNFAWQARHPTFHVTCPVSTLQVFPAILVEPFSRFKSMQKNQSLPTCLWCSECALCFRGFFGPDHFVAWRFPPHRAYIRPPVEAHSGPKMEAHSGIAVPKWSCRCSINIAWQARHPVQMCLYDVGVPCVFVWSLWSWPFCSLEISSASRILVPQWKRTVVPKWTRIAVPKWKHVAVPKWNTRQHQRKNNLQRLVLVSSTSMLEDHVNVLQKAGI